MPRSDAEQEPNYRINSCIENAIDGCDSDSGIYYAKDSEWTTNQIRDWREQCITLICVGVFVLIMLWWSLGFEKRQADGAERPNITDVVIRPRPTPEPVIPREPMHLQLDKTTGTIEIEDSKKEVIIWGAPFRCEPCDRMRHDCGRGGKLLDIDYRKGPPPWFAEAQAANPSIGYPIAECHRSDGWKYKSGYQSLDDLSAWAGANEAVTARGPWKIGTINGQATVKELLTVAKQHLGNGTIEIRWQRNGKSRVPIGASKSEFLGDSGRIEVEFIAVKEIPPGWPAKYGCGYVIRANNITLAPDSVTLNLDTQTTSSTEEQPVGSIAVITTILSIASNIWAITHPEVSVTFSEEMKTSVSVKDDELIVDIPAGPSIELRWSFLFGLVKPVAAIPLKCVRISETRILCDFDSRLIKQIELCVVK